MCDNLEKIITNLMAPVKRIIIAGKRSHDEIFAGVGAGGGRGGRRRRGGGGRCDFACRVPQGSFGIRFSALSAGDLKMDFARSSFLLSLLYGIASLWHGYLRTIFA